MAGQVAGRRQQAQASGVQRGVGQRADADRQVGPFLDQIDHGFAAHQLQPHQGVSIQKIRRQRCKQVVQHRRGRIDTHQA